MFYGLCIIGAAVTHSCEKCNELSGYQVCQHIVIFRVAVTLEMERSKGWRGGRALWLGGWEHSSILRYLASVSASVQILVCLRFRTEIEIMIISTSKNCSFHVFIFIGT